MERLWEDAGEVRRGEGERGKIVKVGRERQMREGPKIRRLPLYFLLQDSFK